ncbi:aspartate carbamoyltransferase, partial [Geobacillus stearothermophilus]|nr:aspartate carbamoyltransferase [Geobacillus stearothermophilus]
MTHLFTLSELPLSDITRLLDEAEAFRRGRAWRPA